MDISPGQGHPSFISSTLLCSCTFSSFFIIFLVLFHLISYFSSSFCCFWSSFVCCVLLLPNVCWISLFPTVLSLQSFSFAIFTLFFYNCEGWHINLMRILINSDWFLTCLIVPFKTRKFLLWVSVELNKSKFSITKINTWNE